MIAIADRGTIDDLIGAGPVIMITHHGLSAETMLTSKNVWNTVNVKPMKLHSHVLGIGTRYVMILDVPGNCGRYVKIKGQRNGKRIELMIQRTGLTNPVKI